MVIRIKVGVMPIRSNWREVDLKFVFMVVKVEVAVDCF
jgi:hypothetical protein